jgi:hypothetical protein
MSAVLDEYETYCISIRTEFIGWPESKLTGY